MRFPRSGKNWEGRSWKLAPCLDTLADQIEAIQPKPHPADGTVASEPHDFANPSSDHRPAPFSAATGTVVRALDAGENTEDNAFKAAEAIRKSKDARVKYVIHEGRLYSSYPAYGIAPFTWREYKGPFHPNHFHISTHSGADADTKPWAISATSGGTYIVNATRSDVQAGSKGSMVAVAQSLLAQKGYPPANSFNSAHKPDGIAGEGFDKAVTSFQKAKGLSADGIVGPKTWAALEKA